MFKLNLSREDLLKRSKENRNKLIEKELEEIKIRIEDAVDRGLEYIYYLIDNRHAHIREDIVEILNKEGLTAKVQNIPAFDTRKPTYEIQISWKDESGIELY